MSYTQVSCVARHVFYERRPLAHTYRQAQESLHETSEQMNTVPNGAQEGFAYRDKIRWLDSRQHRRFNMCRQVSAIFTFASLDLRLVETWAVIHEGAVSYVPNVLQPELYYIAPPVVTTTQ